MNFKNSFLCTTLLLLVSFSFPSFADNFDKITFYHELSHRPELIEKIKKELAHKLIKIVHSDSFSDQKIFLKLLENNIFFEMAQDINRSLLILNIEAGIRPDGPSTSYKKYLKQWIKFFFNHINTIINEFATQTNTDKFKNNHDLITLLLLLECDANVHLIIKKNHNWLHKSLIRFDPPNDDEINDKLNYLHETSETILAVIIKLNNSMVKKNFWDFFSNLIKY